MLQVEVSKAPNVLLADSGCCKGGSEGQSEYAEAFKHIPTIHSNQSDLQIHLLSKI